jgi:uncharacterized protein
LKEFIALFFSGLTFAIGLGVSGMTDANKVIGFLDLSGSWDPSLAFVMIGAIAVHLISYKLVMKRDSPVFADKFDLPTSKDIDLKLVAGAGIFGVGWALGGFCPGPGLVSTASLGAEALVFTATMIVGMLVYRLVAARN